MACVGSEWRLGIDIAAAKAGYLSCCVSARLKACPDTNLYAGYGTVDVIHVTQGKFFALLFQEWESRSAGEGAFLVLVHQESLPARQRGCIIDVLPGELSTAR